MTDPTRTRWYLRPFVEAVRDYGIRACEAKAKEIARGIVLSGPVADIGGGMSNHWHNAVIVDAMLDRESDFNTTSIQFRDASIGLVVCEQVIEHLHNTTWFLSELHRILKPGGHLLLSTENLASLPNIFALLCQRAPFSTQAVCGQFLGGWKSGPAGYSDGVPEWHPTASGVHGHVRVMTTGQLLALLRQAGFGSLRKWGFGGNHYILAHGIKP